VVSSKIGYIASYREAGDVLAQTIIQQGPTDLLLFPMLFAYRHWLELELKALITLARWCCSDEREPIRHHRLADLAARLQSALPQALPTEDLSFAEPVWPLLAEIAQIDPTSEGFRYPRVRKGQMTIPQSLERVNIGHRLSDGTHRSWTRRGLRPFGRDARPSSRP
jgi:hypothetical protein